MTHLIKEGITNIKEKGLIKTRKLHHTNVLFDDKYTTTKVLLGKERERERETINLSLTTPMSLMINTEPRRF